MGELVVASDMDIPIGRPSIPRTVAMYSIWSLTEWTKCRLRTIHAARRTMQVGPRSAPIASHAPDWPPVRASLAGQRYGAPSRESLLRKG
jgi:hypothetical protein